MASAPSELLTGVGLIGRGGALLVKRPRLFWLGAVPPLITSVLFTVILVVLTTQLDAVTAALTPFADGWTDGLRLTLRVLAGTVLVAGTILLMVLVFSTLTLALGAPIYDTISGSVDRAFPDAPPERAESVVRAGGRAVRQAVALIAVSALGAVVFLLIGVIPVVGQVAAGAGGAIFGGWVLVVDLVGSGLERRGVLALRGGREALRRRRRRARGLGIPCFLLLSVPFVSVVVFPVAVAAATLLVRQLQDESTELSVGEDAS